MIRTTTSLVAALLCVALAAPSQAATGREEVQEYPGPNGVVVGTIYGGWRVGYEELRFTPRRGERSARFRVEDAAGRPVRVHVHVNLDGDHIWEETHRFCGGSERIKVRPQWVVFVEIVAGECPGGGTVSTPTRGEVTAIFSR